MIFIVLLFLFCSNVRRKHRGWQSSSLLCFTATWPCTVVFWQIYHLKSQRITKAATATPEGQWMPAPNIIEIHTILVENVGLTEVLKGTTEGISSSQNPLWSVCASAKFNSSATVWTIPGATSVVRTATEHHKYFNLTWKHPFANNRFSFLLSPVFVSPKRTVYKSLVKYRLTVCTTVMNLPIFNCVHFWILIGWNINLPRVIWESVLSLELQPCPSPASERKTLH